MLLALLAACGRSEEEDSTPVEVDGDCVALQRWAPDADGDGHGSAEDVVLACEAPAGYLDDESDCDDASAEAHPGHADLCADGIDGDCDGRDPRDLDEPIGGDSTDAYLRLLEPRPGGALGGVLAARAVPGHVSFYSGEPGTASVYTKDLDSSGAIEVDLAAWFASGPDGSRFGEALATGAFGGETWEDLAVGAPGGDGEPGAVYIFVDTESTPRVLSDGDGTGFGGTLASQAIVVDVEELVPPGGPLLLAGTSHGDGGTARSGAWLLEGPFLADADVSTLGTLLLSDDAGDDAGAALDLADADGDGVDEALVAAPLASVDGVATGAVWVARDGALQAGVRLTGATGDGAAFGYSVAGLGDYTGDGYEDVAVGAPFELVGDVASAGRAWVWAGPLTEDQAGDDAWLVLSGTEAYDLVGYTVAGIGDVTDDGLPDVGIVAGWGSGGFAGTLYGYTCGARGIMVRDDATMRISGDESQAFFGTALLPFLGEDAEDDGIVVGAPGRTDQSPGGSAYAFLFQG